MQKISRLLYYIMGIIFSASARVLAGEEITEEMGRDFDSFIFGKQVLFGTFLGFLIGFTLKKSLKILLYVTGVIVIIMIILSKYDLLVIQWANFQELYNNFAGSFNFSELFNQAYLWLSESIAVTGSFGVGFFIGIKVG